MIILYKCILFCLDYGPMHDCGMTNFTAENHIQTLILPQQSTNHYNGICRFSFTAKENSTIEVEIDYASFIALSYYAPTLHVGSRIINCVEKILYPVTGPGLGRPSRSTPPP